MPVPYDSFDYPLYWEKRSYENEAERFALLNLLEKIEKKESLIDIGGGFGRLAAFYSPLFTSCVILEPSEKLIGIGKEKLRNFQNVSFQKGSLPKLPFASGSFEVALMIRVVHHLDSPLPAFREVNRILKKDGYFILEAANKIHFLERVKVYFKGDSSFVNDLSPIDKRSRKSIEEKKIVFLNHHPKKIMEDLNTAGFSVAETLSVSNFRSQLLKKIIPEKLLLYLERKTQKPLAKYFFGPSIFFLAKKV